METGSVRLVIDTDPGSSFVVEAKSLYTSVAEAASIAGVSYDTMSSWANSPINPIPHIPVGRSKKLIRVSAIPTYAKTQEVS